VSARRPALGRGIGALLSGAPAVVPKTEAASRSEAPASGGVHSIPVEAIDPNPDQPRRHFDDAELARLSESIRRHGVLQPVVVRRSGERYELLVGERRWRASRAAGLTEIPAVISDIEAAERLEIALVENVQRHDLNPMELALAFRAMADGGATQEEIGVRVGMERSSVANHIRLLELPREIQADVEAGRLGSGHAKALLQISNPERRRHLRDRIVSEGLSVRAAEEAARTESPRRNESRAVPPPIADPNLQRAVDSLRQRLQTRVRMRGDGTRGRIEIEYFGAEDLRRIIDLMLGVAAE
jgi:ParB family chromosome partitioning protein